MKSRTHGYGFVVASFILLSACSNGGDVVELDLVPELVAEIGDDVATADSQAEIDAVAGCRHHAECRERIGDVGHCIMAYCDFGECVVEDLSPGSPCEDGQVCTTPDTCKEGVCIPGPDRCMCRDDWECANYDKFLCGPFYRCLMKTEDVGICVLDPLHTIECDGEYDTHCLKNTCNPGTGQCQPTPVEDGTGCDDQDNCTLGDHCKAGECVEQVPLNCDDLDPCTGDGCDPQSGCMHEPLTGPDCGFGQCFDGECKCVPDCGDRECGPHNCAGVCGLCVPQMEKCSPDGYCLSATVAVEAGEYAVGTTHDGGPHDDCAFLGISPPSWGGSYWECKEDLPFAMVQVEPFHVDGFEVTNGQFLRFVQAIGSVNGQDADGALLFSSFATGKFDGYPYYPGLAVDADGSPMIGSGCFGYNSPTCLGYFDDLTGLPTPPPPDCTRFPAVVTHEGARQYCEWAGKRLCTEVEYEAACGGPEGFIWPWGNELEARQAYYARWSICETAALVCDWEAAALMPDIKAIVYMWLFWVGNMPVGSYPMGKSPSGAFDMVGNAPEWVADTYAKVWYGKLQDWAWVRGGPQFKYGGNPAAGFHRRCSSRSAAQAGAIVALEAPNFNGFRCCSDAP